MVVHGRSPEAGNGKSDRRHPALATGRGGEGGVDGEGRGRRRGHLHHHGRGKKWVNCLCLCIFFFLDEFEAVLLGETCDASLFLLP